MELRSLSGYNPKGDRGESNPNCQGHNLVSSPLDHDHHGLLYELVNVRAFRRRSGRVDSNHRHAGCKPAALAAELRPVG